VGRPTAAAYGVTQDAPAPFGESVRHQAGTEVGETSPEGGPAAAQPAQREPRRGCPATA